MQTKSEPEPVPLRVEFPAGLRRENQLQIVDPTSFRRNILPGWTVVNRPASSDGSVDTYFIEPGTGRQFPSLESVHKHLTGQVNDRCLSRAGAFFKEKTRVYEGSRSKQDHRSIEYASKGFRLPKGWAREEVPRKNSYHIDKYYVERMTGKRFRSLVSVERYLRESGNISDQQLMLLPYHRGRSKDFSLPDGWIIEEKPRRNSGQIDKSYIEPGTGNKFRSLAAVERYLHSQQLSLVGFQKEVMDPNPPKKVKWVLTGPGGSMFSPYMKGSDVSNSAKQKWSEAFVSNIQDRA